MDDNIELRPVSKNPTLPWWSDEFRGMPNSMIRSALFGVFKKGEGVKYDKELICSANGTQIIYTGESLSQFDLGIFLELLHLCRARIANNIMEFGPVEFSVKEFLEKYNESRGGNDANSLLLSIQRLRSASVEISDRQYIYAGHLIHNMIYDKELEKYWLEINPLLANLFGDCGFTKIDTAIRSKLRGKPKAQWIFNFYSSHTETKIFKYSVTTINDLMGVKNKDKYGARRDLKDMMTDVEDATRHAIQVGDEIHVVGWKFTYEISKANKEKVKNVLISLDKNYVFEKSDKPKLVDEANEVEDDDEPF